MSFKNLKLSPEILRALKDLEYKEPTPIQKESIDILKRGRDLLLIAKTGTGKTAAFALPMINDIQKDHTKQNKLTKLIIAPTKELVQQLQKSIQEYAKYTDIKVDAIYGGTKLNTQIKRLCFEKPNIVIATTGRLLDLLKQNHINLTKVDTLVLDESDTMLDLGFVKDIEFLLEHLTNLKQIVLSSATLQPSVKKLSNQILHNPKVIEVKSNDRVNENLTQEAYIVPQKNKLEFLSFLIGSKNIQQSLVFCKTKALADEIEQNLNLDGLKAAAVHGDKTQGKRKKLIAQFKEGKIQVLVATDVAARGLDIEDLPCVINFDLPFMVVDYLHRVGRTARAGKSGLAISILDEYDISLIKEIEKYLGLKIPKEQLDGFDTDKKLQTIAKKTIVQTKDDKKAGRIKGAFGNKKRLKASKKEPKLRGKRIIGQQR